jgi:hypothetical protein
MRRERGEMVVDVARDVVSIPDAPDAGEVVDLIPDGVEWRFEPERIDWRRYWLDVHMPGLRRWAFPLIEGKRPERYKPLHPVKLSVPPPPLAQAEPAVALTS